ncbi:DUF6338 family protein [Natrialba hulunbeirensis]|uniref:DUF6338 family protein n=1 Tax=Natrialba hulunbeirensis TaxID=123783 RepID=UPI000A46AB6A|nr:DUF6338 family protein [Natrialba hulunbeirensis]
MGTLVGQTGGVSFSPADGIITLFIPLLLVVPGLVAVRLGLWTARRENPFTQLETLVVSALVSLASLFFIYVGLSIWHWHPTVLSDIQSQSLPWFVIGYCVHVFVAACTGMALGSFAYNYLLDNEARSRYDPWQYVFRQLTDSATIDVRTTSGLWVRGHLTKAEESTETRDLLLTSVNFLDKTPERDPHEAANQSTETLDRNSMTTDSKSSEIQDHDERPILAERTDDTNTGSWETIEQNLDEYFEANDEIQAALDDNSAGYMQLDGAAIEAIRVPDSTDVNTNEVYEELSNTDRVHKRAALLGDEFGYFSIEACLRSYCAGLNRAILRWIITLLLWITMLIVTIGSVGVIEISGEVSVHRAGLTWIALCTGISTVELIQHYSDSPMQWAEIPRRIGALTPFIASVLVIEWWVVGNWEILLDALAVLAGLLGGVTVGTVLHHLRDEYTATAALAVGIISTSLLALVTLYAFRVVVKPAVGQTLLLVAGAGTLGLFCERIRVGKAGAYEDWATVLADTVAMALAIGAAGLVFWSVGIASSPGTPGFFAAVILASIGFLAGGAALHGVVGVSQSKR